MIIILDKDKLVVFQNEKSPVSNDCRLGRFETNQSNLITILDKDKLVILLNDLLPIINDCRLGRFENVKLSNIIIISISFFNSHFFNIFSKFW